MHWALDGLHVSRQPLCAAMVMELCQWQSWPQNLSLMSIARSFKLLVDRCTIPEPGMSSIKLFEVSKVTGPFLPDPDDLTFETHFSRL